MCFESIVVRQGLLIVAPVFRTPVTPFCSAYVAGMQHAPSAETSPANALQQRFLGSRTSILQTVARGCACRFHSVHGRRSLMPSQVCDFASRNGGRFMALHALASAGDKTMRLSEGRFVNGGGSGTPVAKRACMQYDRTRNAPFHVSQTWNRHETNCLLEETSELVTHLKARD